jgi:Protein of unknown function (DUF3572)
MHETNDKNKATHHGDPSALALNALGWILADEARAERMLSLTGITPDGLRDAIRSPALQAAILRHLEGHEPDLIACADVLSVAPDALVAARRELEI